MRQILPRRHPARQSPVRAGPGPGYNRLVHAFAAFPGRSERTAVEGLLRRFGAAEPPPVEGPIALGGGTFRPIPRAGRLRATAVRACPEPARIPGCGAAQTA